jgi:hypothetical protein
VIEASAFVKSLLAAPVYYLLPLGVGLLATAFFKSGLTRTQHVLLAYLVGLVAITALLVAREQGRIDAWPIEPIAAAIALAALAGFVVARRIFRWDAAARSALIDFAVVSPVFALAYLFRFGMFSDYPLTDLFQATHLMKGALDFGRFDMLNPFTTASYVPATQVLEGLMVRFLGFEPLPGIWLLSALSVAPKFLALRSVVQNVFQAREERLLALAAAACFMSSITPTNGDLAMLGSLLVFALAISAANSGRLLRSTLVVAVGVAALGAGYLAARTMPLVYLSILAATCALPLLANRLPIGAAGLALVSLIIAIVPVHRSAMAFVPVGLACGALLPLLAVWAGRHRRHALTLAVACGAITVVGGLAAIGVLQWVALHPADDMREFAPSRWVVETILQATLSGNFDIIAGSGPKVALFELGRAMSPSFVAAAALVAALCWWRTIRARGGVDDGSDAAGLSHEALAAWLLAVGIGCVGLVGIPFVYRSGFFIIALVAIALAAGLAAVMRAPHPERINRLLLALVAAYVTLAIPLAYGCAPPFSCTGTRYLEMADPFITATATLTLAGALAGIAFAKQRVARAVITPAVLVLLFTLEFGMSRAYFMPHSYGSAAARSGGVISHLSEQEIELAQVIRAFGGAAILVSDPYTMANLRALTGLNSAVSFSNLDSQSPAAAQRLRTWLRAVVFGEKSGVCADLSPLAMIDGYTSSPEFNYWLARVSSPQLSGREVLGLFGYRNSFVLSGLPSLIKGTDPPDFHHGWRRDALKLAAAHRAFLSSDPWAREPMFLVVVGRKTVRWALHDRQIGYFPDVAPLERKLVDDLAARCEMRLHDGRFALIRFSMTPAQ